MSLVSLWRFADGSGSEAKDSVGPNNGTLVNSPAWVAGIYNSALDFNSASTQYVSISETTTIITSNDWTFSAWISRDASATFVFIFACGDFTIDGAGFELYIGDTDRVQASVWTSSLSEFLSTGTISEDSSWHHVVLRKNGTALTIWIDGVQDGDATAPSATMDWTSSANRTYIGLRNDGTFPFEGRIDEVGLYNHALTDDEIRNLASGVIAGVAIKPGSGTFQQITGGFAS